MRDIEMEIVELDPGRRAYAFGYRFALEMAGCHSPAGYFGSADEAREAVLRHNLGQMGRGVWAQPWAVVARPSALPAE